MNRFLRLWTGPLPKEELFPTDRKINPLLHWFIHPVKRKIAKYYLRILQKLFSLKVIAIGGSNGKTTTRTMLYSILNQVAPTVATADSITSTYNLPTTILKCTPLTKFLILEMSVEYIGDMDFYLWLAHPQIAILTLIDTEHTQNFGTLDVVAKEENKLVTKGKWLTLTNGNSPLIVSDSSPRRYTFGLSPKFNYYIESTKITPDLSTEIFLKFTNNRLKITFPVPGHHLAHPAAAAAAAADLLLISPENIITGLQKYQPAQHRQNLIFTPKGPTIIDDTYNSNPSSASAAIISALEIARITHRELVCVLSQMNELGQYEVSAHQQLGALVKKNSIKHLFTIGPATQQLIKTAQMGTYCESIPALQKALQKYLTPKYLILVKSSRSWKLEQLVSSLFD